jgi:hypothetical protein
MPIWSNGLSNILAITSTLLPNEKNLGDLQEWTESQVNSMLAIPIPDRRRLHGDARFANILVDNVHSSIELIDYGNAQIGHVFQDFARFEVDLWFRSSSNLNHDKQSSNSLAIAETALRRLTIDDDHPLSSSPLRYWRDALLDTFPGFGAPGALQLYRWFLFVELLKRLKWIRENSTSESGTDALTLLQCIAWIRSSIQSSDPLLASALVGNAISSLLHCRAVYVPTTDREREVNRTRNEAKKSAIRKTAQVKGMMRLIAETGNAYFDTRGVFYDEIESLLRKGGEV